MKEFMKRKIKVTYQKKKKDKSQNKRWGENSFLNRELASFWSPGERYGNRIIYDVGLGLNCKVKSIIGNGL